MNSNNSYTAERKKTALVVEDSRDVADVYRVILSRAGWEALILDSGADARHYIENNGVYHLIFLDHYLADDVTGPELARDSKKFNPLVQTVCASDSVPSSSEEGIFDIVIKKPFAERGILWALGQAGF